MCTEDFTKNPITPLSSLNWNVCVCMQNLIYVEAVEGEHRVSFPCVNVRLELKLPSISGRNRGASNQSKIHKSECDKSTAYVCNYCGASEYRAALSKTDYSLTEFIM